MRAHQIMSRHVVTVSSDASIYDAAFILLNANVSAAPVVDAAGKLVGIISESDLARRPEIGTLPRKSLLDCLVADEPTLAQDFIRSHSRRVADVMTRDVVTAGAQARLMEIAGLMARHSVKRIPIVWEGRLLGIVSRADLLRGLIACSPRDAEGTPADDQLRQAVLDELKKRTWATSKLTSVVAEDGVVHLWGYVDDATVRKAYEIAAENVRGVTRVVNHMSILPIEAHLG